MRIAGTDHGAAAPMFLIGGGVKPGLFGKYPSLTNLDNGDLKFSNRLSLVFTQRCWINGCAPRASSCSGKSFQPCQLFRWCSGSMTAKNQKGYGVSQRRRSSKVRASLRFFALGLEAMHPAERSRHRCRRFKLGESATTTSQKSASSFETEFFRSARR
jgi:hypothetical protein